jgi:two-component system, cell cycle response regulator
MLTSTPMPGGLRPDADTAPAPDSADDSTERARGSPLPEPPRRVLLVEPLECERERLRNELEAVGLEVHACADLDPAGDAASSAEPSVILARWDRPSGNGLELLRRLKDQGLTAWTPVVLHGGHPTAEERTAAFDLGAFDVIEVTPGAAELRARLRAALRLRERIDQLEHRAYRDSLTGLINRGALDDQLRRHWELARRHETSLSVLFVDLDRFKEINDAHGHVAGDEVLRRTSAVLVRSVRSSDIVGRYAGDEFVVVAPDCPPGSAVALAIRFRDGLAASPDAPVACPIPITLSIGIAGADGPALPGLDELIHRADQALYLAKRSGRNAVALYDPSRGGPVLID